MAFVILLGYCHGTTPHRLDPRIDRRKPHKLQDIFFITLCAVICGAYDCVSIEQFGEAKEVLKLVVAFLFYN